ncbi:MAG: DUF58 domain-containing protein, partial [Rariglobus sp.]
CRAEPRENTVSALSSNPVVRDSDSQGIAVPPRVKTQAVPAPRAIVWVGGLLALAVLAGPLPELAPFWMIASALLVLIALLDLARGLTGDNWPEVAAPAVVRLTKDRPGTLPLTFSGLDGRGGAVRLALAAPVVFDVEDAERDVVFVKEAPRALAVWKLTPTRRGRFGGLLACLARTSPWGFWELRRRVPLATEVRVMPNLMTERKAFSALFLDRGPWGMRARRQVGRGRDFEKLRDYLPGDGFDEIDWKATAKRGKPVTKIFQVERTQEVYVVIDASRLSARTLVRDGKEVTALERSITAAMVLLLAAQRQGDRFGLVVYDDRVRVFIAAGGGSGHYATCRDAVHALQPGEASPDAAEVVRSLRQRLRRRALVFILTDLSDPVVAEDFSKHLPLLGRQHLVHVNQLCPPEVAPLFTGAEARSTEEVYRRLAGHLRWTEARALAQRLRPAGVAVQLLRDEAYAAELLTQYLKVKQRQAL